MRKYYRLISVSILALFTFFLYCCKEIKRTELRDIPFDILDVDGIGLSVETEPWISIKIPASGSKFQIVFKNSKDNIGAIDIYKGEKFVNYYEMKTLKENGDFISGNIEYSLNNFGKNLDILTFYPNDSGEEYMYFFYLNGHYETASFCVYQCTKE